MTLPVKPDVCISDGRLAVFMGANYKFLTLDQADAFVRRLQSELSRLRRQIRREKRREKACTSVD